MNFSVCIFTCAPTLPREINISHKVVHFQLPFYTPEHHALFTWRIQPACEAQPDIQTRLNELMNNLNFATRLIRTTFISACCLSSPIIHASESNWSLVPYAGLSLLGDQNPDILGSTDISDGSAQVDISTGFTAGLGVRYDYENSPWSSELGWEYRSNDAKTTSANGTARGTECLVSGVVSSALDVRTLMKT